MREYDTFAEQLDNMLEGLHPIWKFLINMLCCSVLWALIGCIAYVAIGR